jgi:hypothetical protein
MPCSLHAVSVPPSIIACCAAVGFGFSTLPDDDEDDDELLDDEFVPDPPEPESCFSLSPSPQKVSANVISPNVKIDLM